MNFFKSKMPINVWLLTIAQALVGSVGSMVIFIGGFLGMELAPEKSLATLPIACIVVGTALSTIPVSLMMKKIGRRKTFILMSIFSIIVALFAAYTIYFQSFYLLCFAVLLLGATNASVMQFRFAAMESVTNKFIPKAVSTVLLGGLAAAYLGPEIGLLGKELFNTSYVGSFVLLSGLFSIGLIVLLFFKNPVIEENHIHGEQRPLNLIAKQSVFWLAISSAAIGYAVMGFIMTATPISMHKMDGHSLMTTKTIIQSHIIAMYLPSLITPWIIKKMGNANILLLGLLAYTICIVIAFLNQEAVSYWVALVLLGIGWNFLFIGGTTLLPRSYNPSERFKVQATNDFLVFGTQAIAAFSAGSILFSVGWKQLLLLTIPVILLQAGITLRWKNKIAK